MIRGERLKELRLKKGLTQEELGRAVGVGKSAICCYEKGTRNPALETIIEFMNVLGVTSDYLLGVESIVTTEVEDNNKEYRTMTPEEVMFIEELRKDKTVYEILLNDPKQGYEIIKEKLD